MSEAYEVCLSYLRADIADGKLRPRYLGRKPLTGVDEADRWFVSSPMKNPTFRPWGHSCRQLTDRMVV
jgi:hypothetical protein